MICFITVFLKNKKHKDVQEKTGINTSKYEYYVWCDDFYTKCFSVFYKISTVGFIVRKEQKDILKVTLQT